METNESHKTDIDFLSIILEGYDPEKLEEFQALSLSQIESALSSLLVREALLGRAWNIQIRKVENASLALDLIEEKEETYRSALASAKARSEFGKVDELSALLHGLIAERRDAGRKKMSEIYEQSVIKQSMERFKGLKGIIRDAVRIQRG